MADTRLSDIREETSVDLVDESEAENAKDLELDKAMKQLFKATRNGWALFKVLEPTVHVTMLYLKEAACNARHRR